jgi:hypothetical protein
MLGLSPRMSDRNGSLDPLVVAKARLPRRAFLFVDTPS